MLTLGICNSVTNNIIQANIKSYIFKYCTKYSKSNLTIEPALVKAIIKQECNFKPYSIRFEKHLQTNKKYLKHVPKKYRKDKLAFSSLGCGQVLYATARWLGFRKEPCDLLLMKHSIKYCVIYIRYLIKRFWYIEKVISSYNQGSARTFKTGKYKGYLKNQLQYVNPVLKYYKSFGGKLDISDLIKVIK